MKPLNLDNKPCSPVSSNCIVWQGPDIECIKLCHGDSVSDVVHKLATELCNIMTQLNVSSYDLTCLGITAACPPKDITVLIQLLIDKICELEGLINTSNSNSSGDSADSGCPDCIVSVAECFVVGTTTTMQLTEYVNLIAGRVCDLISEINILQTQISNLNIRVTALEDVPPPGLTLPSIPTDCLASVIPGNPLSATIDIVLTALLSDSTKGFCQYIDKLGLPADIYGAINGVVCITSGTTSDTDPTLTMSGLYNGVTDPKTWVDTPTTLVHTINNLWIAICDSHGKPTIQFTDTETVKFTMLSDRPSYNFEANVTRQDILIERGGLGITLNGTNGGLRYTYPGFLPNSAVLPPVAASSTNASRIDQLQMQTGALGTLTPIYDNFIASPFDATSGVITVPSDGIYDLGMRVHMSANAATSIDDEDIPNGPADNGSYGYGFGFYGGYPTNSNNSATDVNITNAGSTPTASTTAGYTDGLAYLNNSSSVDKPLVYITTGTNAYVDPANPGNIGQVVIITLVTGGSDFNQDDINSSNNFTIVQAGADGSARARAITNLSKPTPTCTIMAGIIEATPGSTESVNHCVDMFNASTAMPYADLSATSLGVYLRQGTLLKFYIGILVTEEDPLKPGTGEPAPRWVYNSKPLDYIQWYFKKVE